MPISIARGSDYDEEGSNTANEAAGLDVLDYVDFDQFRDAQWPVNHKDDIDSKSDFEPPSSPDFGELDNDQSMGDTNGPVNAEESGLGHRRRRPGFGSCGRQFTRTAYQLPTQNEPFVFVGNQSGYNASGHNPYSSNLSDQAPPPTNPDLPVFRSYPRANRRAPSAHSQSLVSYAGASKRRMGGEESFGGGPSQGGAGDKRKAVKLDEGSDGDGDDEGIRNGFKRLNLTEEHK